MSAAAGDPCSEARLGASLALDDCLDDLGRVRLRRHLRSCPRCASVVARMRVSTRMLREQPIEAHGVRLGRLPHRRALRGATAAAIASAAMVMLTLAGSTTLDRREPGNRQLGTGGLELPLGQRSALADFAPGAAGS